MNYRLNLLWGFALVAGTAQGNTDDPYADYAGSMSSARYEDSASGYASSGGGSVYDSHSPVGYDMSGSGSAVDNERIYLPEQSFFEYLGPMKKKNGSGHATMKNWMTKLTLVSATTGSWRFDVDTAFRMSWFDGDKEADMDVSELYTIWLHMGATYRMWGSTYLTFGVNPEFSSDFDSWVARNFEMGAHLLLSSKLSDKFKYSIGLAYAPQLGDSPVLPFIGFSWQASPNWVVEMKGIRLSAMNKVTDYFSWGPFVSVVSGSWVVKHDRSHSRFEWRSGVAGLATETGLGQWGKVRPKLLVDAGFSFANTARFKTTNGRHELEKKSYDPGFYVRAGLNFSF